MIEEKFPYLREYTKAYENMFVMVLETLKINGWDKEHREVGIIRI